MGESDVQRTITVQETSQLLDAASLDAASLDAASLDAASLDAASLNGALFDRAALLVGRPLYWVTSQSPMQHVEGLETLIRWCLSLPDARLGISVSDATTIVRDVFANRWQLDQEIWDREHLVKLMDWIQQVPRVDDYLWLDPEDCDWWITATMRSIAGYSGLFDVNADSTDILRLISRHGCTVFAPFEGAATRDQLDSLIERLPPNRQDFFAEQLADPRIDRTGLAEIRDVCWSWRLINFSNVDGSITWTPMLALWSERPSSAQWAPQSRTGAIARRQHTADQITFLLEDTFWQRLETLLSTAREACGLGVSEPEFAEVESRPPLFYFASPAYPPIRPEEYAESLRPIIMPLVKSCLISTDPLAEQVAWGLLEGNLVALRREFSTRQTNQPRYLLLPTSVRSATARPIEEDVGAVANRLAFLEFAIGHEARDVYTDMEPLAVRRAMWDGTLDLVNGITGEAIDLLPSAHKSHAGRINTRLASLHLLLRRLQTSIETAASDANQVEVTYNSYLDSTDIFLRRTLTSSSVPRVSALNMRDSIQHAYPYQYVKLTVESLQGNMSKLSSSVDRIGASLNTVLELSDRRIRDLSSRLTGMFNFIIALLALLVGLAQVIGAQSGASISAASSAPTGLLGRLAQISQLNTAARIFFELVGLLLIATAVVYAVEWVGQRLPRPQHKFVVDMQHFRAVVSAAEEYAERASASEQDGREAMWRQVDRLDDEAVQILARLWRELRFAQDGVGGRTPGGRVRRLPRRIRIQGVREWERRARVVEHAIELFDLSPRVILLPRALCVLRFKSTDFHRRTIVSDWDFGASLRAIGYSSAQAHTLESWLSTLANHRQIQEWDVTAFTRALKEHGVTADPAARAPDRWHGQLDAASA